MTGGNDTRCIFPHGKPGWRERAAVEKFTSVTPLRFSHAVQAGGLRQLARNPLTIGAKKGGYIPVFALCWLQYFHTVWTDADPDFLGGF